MPANFDAKYIVGIDLGTTNCLLAYTPASVSEDEDHRITLFPVPQLVSAGEVQAQPLLPSFLFLAGPNDVPAGGLALPWDDDLDYAVGEFARSRGAELPSRLVASAKSWLCHAGVDRVGQILPWETPADARRVSPVEATARYLEHLRKAWNHAMAAGSSEARLEHQAIYLTVPASFDAVARELTVEAARAAGLEHVTLQEEPQAAFYAWIDARKDWRDVVGVGDSVLVCDVGGGTTDFSLIEVIEEEGRLALRRVAVGDHILLGGDNMDLALAHTVRAKLAKDGVQLDKWQFQSLWHSCRRAKERLLGDADVEKEAVVVLGRGSALIGGTIETELTREEVETVLVEGFFPYCEATDSPERKPRVGIREMGLPHESDPAVTRHLARFLGRQVSADGSGPAVAFPSAVLFNGGVMKAAALRERVLAVLEKWGGGGAPREFSSASLDAGVALGAAYYGLAREGRGVRIRAGTARSYYIGVESALPSVPGVPTPMKALCVVPFGMEEGTEAQIREKEFGLVVGEPAEFHLLGATTRKRDRAGEVVEDWSGDLQEVTTMETLLPATETEESGTVLPVCLESRVTEVGTLELWCVASEGDRRWKLEFNIREEEET